MESQDSWNTAQGTCVKEPEEKDESFDGNIEKLAEEASNVTAITMSSQENR